MLYPRLLARIEQKAKIGCLRIKRPEVAAFVSITTPTSIG
jgi:hypothetical protein